MTYIARKGTLWQPPGNCTKATVLSAPEGRISFVPHGDWRDGVFAVGFRGGLGKEGEGQGCRLGDGANKHMRKDSTLLRAIIIVQPKVGPCGLLSLGPLTCTFGGLLHSCALLLDFHSTSSHLSLDPPLPGTGIAN